MSALMNPCCTPRAVLTRQPAALRGLPGLRESLRGMLRAWAQHLIARRRIAAEQHLLLQLSDATLRDLGLAERGLSDPARNFVDWERGRRQ